MSNATARRARKAAQTAAQEGPIVTATQSIGNFVIEELGEYEFTRQGAGRKREASPFDDAIDGWVGTGTRRIPVESEEDGKEAVKLLAKSAEYKNRGLEKRVEQDENDNWFVIFKVNAEKAKRAPRKGKAEDGVTDAAEGAETE